MKDNLTKICVFCGAPATAPKHNEVLEIHRLCKRPQKSDRIDKISITLPTCPACYRKHHPFYKIGAILPLCAGIIAVVCVIFSLIQKDFFSGSGVLGAIVTLLFTAGGAFLFTWFGYLMTTWLFDDAFKVSIKVKPYSDLEAVKYIKSKGFIDADDNDYVVVNTEDAKFISIQTFREELQYKYGCCKKL